MQKLGRIRYLHCHTQHVTPAQGACHTLVCVWAATWSSLPC